MNIFPLIWICCKCGALTDDGVPARLLCMKCADEYEQDLIDLEADMAADVVANDE